MDITSSEGTPIYAIEDGEVVRARSNPGYGNLITIKHTLNNGNTVYSINGHLETMIVKEGSKVSE
ncbi:M23 family metallopeptidase [Patescibacteria group bacterium]|nr:M23 family metallopeptidase [Patescibacteria group bacterium]